MILIDIRVVHRIGAVTVTVRGRAAVIQEVSETDMEQQLLGLVRQVLVLVERWVVGKTGILYASPSRS